MLREILRKLFGRNSVKRQPMVDSGEKHQPAVDSSEKNQTTVDDDLSIDRKRQLHSIIKSNNLWMTYYYCFSSEEKARQTYEGLRDGSRWLPLKCAVALRRVERFYPYWVVIYNGEPEYSFELPKRRDEAWYWNQYLPMVRLPKQDEFDKWTTDDKFWLNEQIAELLEFFLSPSLEAGVYKCVVCSEAFQTHEQLMKHVQSSDHEDQFNAAMIRQLEAPLLAEAGRLIEDKAGDTAALTELLKDKNRYVRRSAATALGKTGELDAVEPLIKVLQDSDEKVRASAEEALAELGDISIDLLVEALGSYPETRHVAAAVLEILKWEPSDETQRISYLCAKKDWEELARMGPQAAPSLLQAVVDEGLNKAHGAVEALCHIGEPTVGILTDALRSENYKVRAAAALCLGYTGSKEAIEPLISALSDETQEVQENAAHSLGHIPDERAVEALGALLQKCNRVVNCAALEALRAVGDSCAVQHIIRALGHSLWTVRGSAAKALGKIGDPAAVDALEQALQDSNDHVRESAEYALKRIRESKE